MYGFGRCYPLGERRVHKDYAPARRRRVKKNFGIFLAVTYLAKPEAVACAPCEALVLVHLMTQRLAWEKGT